MTHLGKAGFDSTDIWGENGVLARFTRAAEGIAKAADRIRDLEPPGELLAAAIELRDDLLMRGRRDDDGTIIVNASRGRWARFTRAIEQAGGK